jgi:hypothetical protein
MIPSTEYAKKRVGGWLLPVESEQLLVVFFNVQILFFGPLDFKCEAHPNFSATKSILLWSPLLAVFRIPGKGHSQRTEYPRAIKIRRIGSYNTYSLKAEFTSQAAR